MEKDESRLSTNEIEERIRELEHAYAEFFGDNADVSDLHHIRKMILELQKELGERKNV